LALSANGAEIAAISAEHDLLSRWPGSRGYALARFATNLTKPSYDAKNGLWIAGESPGGGATLWVIDTSRRPIPAAKPRQIAAPWLAKRQVLALRVAPDNQRVALITSDFAGKDQQIVVAGIVRSAAGIALSLAPQGLRVGQPLTNATDLAWVDDYTLAVIGARRATGPTGPFLVEIGGKLSALSPVQGARLITNTGGLRGVVVITDSSAVLARAGNGWQELQTGTDFLIPGQ
jgi:hypothetical protein